MTEGETTFVLPGSFDPKTLSASLPGFEVSVGDSSRPTAFQMLDCYDQSIRANGRVLIQGAGELNLILENGQILSQAGSGQCDFVQDLSDGPVRKALVGFLKLRALTTIGQGERSTTTFAVLDDVQKTQMRGELTTLTSVNGQASVVSVRPMRGYEGTYQAVCKLIDAMPVLANGMEPFVAALFPNAVPYQAKPEIKLGRDEPSIEVATDIIQTFLSVARQNEAGITADIDTEFLHDYRVSLRRIRSVLSLFKGVLSPAQTAELKQTFAALMSPTGRVRDLDVYLLEKETYFELIPTSLHAGAEDMFTEFQAERTKALEDLRKWLQSSAYEKEICKLTSLFATSKNLDPGPNAERSAFDYACELIWKRYSKVCKLARRITPQTPDALVHDLRIDCKKLRYLMEFFGPLYDRKAFKTIIKPLKRLQDNLGQFNDCSVQKESLLAFVEQKTNKQNRANAQLAMSIGGLIAVLDERQKAERDQVINNFRHFDSPKIRALFQNLFHRMEG